MDETRVNAGYFARLVGFILSLILLGLVIWFVVQIGQDENGVVVTDDEENATTNITEDLIGDSEVVVISKDEAADQTTVTDGAVQSAATDDELVVTTSGSTATGTAAEAAGATITPKAGPLDTTLGAIAIGLAVVAFRSYRKSRRQYGLINV